MLADESARRQTARYVEAPGKSKSECAGHSDGVGEQVADESMVPAK